jgi:mRNA interferase RelE/StbE
VTYQIIIMPAALKALLAVADRRVQGKIRDRIDGLALDPEKQGKPLRDELKGLRSLRAVGQRYRVVYRVEERKIVVMVVALGLRREGDRADIYVLAQKLLKAGLVS